MKKTRKRLKLLIPLLAVMMLASATYATTNVKADDSKTFSPLVKRMIERFNLNENEVEEVVDEFRDEHHFRMQERMAERLGNLISEGLITEEQKDSLLDKFAEMRMEHEEMMGVRWKMTEEQRLAAYDAHRDQLESWATENGLNLNEILGVHGWGMRHHGGHFLR